MSITPGPRSAAHLFVNRPVQAIPEPDPFIESVLVAITEGVVLSGYDFTGRTLDPNDGAAMLAELARVNHRIPGTVGIHLTFMEAPILVGFGTAYTSVTCTVYDADGKVLLAADLDPPDRRSLKDLLLPPKHPDVDGRTWGRRVWEETLSLVLPRRG